MRRAGVRVGGRWPAQLRGLLGLIRGGRLETGISRGTGSIAGVHLRWKLRLFIVVLAVCGFAVCGGKLLPGVVAGRSAGATSDGAVSGLGLSVLLRAAAGHAAELAHALQQARASALRRRRWLEGTRQRDQRVISQMAFHGLGAHASQQLLAHDFGSALASVSANPAASIAREGHLVRYLGNNSAVLRTSHGLEVKTSTAPLRAAHDSSAGPHPVDLSLTESSSGYVPTNPLVPISIPRTPNRAVDIGTEGLGITFQGDKTTAKTMNGQDVFFAGVGTDMDTVVTPTLHGVELSALLRSRLSPEALTYRLVLPKDDVLTASSDGGAVVARKGKIIARIPAPISRDAQGTGIPTSLRIDGDDLVITVDRHRREMAFPIFVDPEVVVTEEGAAWKLRKETPASLFDWSAPNGGPVSVYAPYGRYKLLSSAEGSKNGLLAWDGEWPSELPSASEAKFEGVSFKEESKFEGKPEGAGAISWPYSMPVAIIFTSTPLLPNVNIILVGLNARMALTYI